MTTRPTTPVARIGTLGPPTAGAGRRSSVGLAMLLGAVAVLPWILIGLAAPRLPVRLVLAVVSVLLVMCAALLLSTDTTDGRRGIAHWRVGPWYLLWSTLTLGVMSLQWLSPDPKMGFAFVGRIDPASVVDALAVVAVAHAVWAAGYRVGLPGTVVRVVGAGLATLSGGPRAVVRGRLMPWAVYGLGTVAYVVHFVQSGRFGFLGDPRAEVYHSSSTSQPVYLLAQMTLVAIGGAAFRAFDPTIRGGRATLWTLVAIEVTAGMLRGSKQSFFLVVLAVLIPYGALRGRLPWRWLVVTGLLFFMAVVPFNAAYRGMVRTGLEGGAQQTLSVSSAFGAAPDVFASVLDSESAREDSGRVFLFRIRMIDSVAIVVQRTPSRIAYREPTEYLAAPFVGMVPRLVWPDKPVRTPGYDFSQEYYDQPAYVFSSAAVTPIADLFRHGGWLIVVAGMLLLGTGHRLFDTLFRPEVDPRAFCFILPFFPFVVKTEQDYYDMLTAVPAALAVGVLGARLMCRGVRPVSPDGPGGDRPPPGLPSRPGPPVVDKSAVVRPRAGRGSGPPRGGLPPDRTKGRNRDDKPPTFRGAGHRIPPSGDQGVPQRSTAAW